MAIVFSERALTVQKLISELQQYPAGMSVYVGDCERLTRENLKIARGAGGLGSGAPAVLLITSEAEDGSDRCRHAALCMHFEEA